MVRAAGERVFYADYVEHKTHADSIKRPRASVCVCGPTTFSSHTYFSPKHPKSVHFSGGCGGVRIASSATNERARASTACK